MFCPNCGSNNSTEQKFCRACGLNLEKSAESLIEQRPDEAGFSMTKQQQLLERFGSIAFGGFAVLLLAGIGFLIYMIMDKFVIPGPAGNIITGIFLILFILFATLGLAYVVMNEMLKEKKQKTNPYMEKELAAKDTGKLLEQGNLQPVPSVTDHTTELLYDKSRTQKLD